MGIEFQRSQSLVGEYWYLYFSTKSVVEPHQKTSEEPYTDYHSKVICKRIAGQYDDNLP